MGLPLCRDPPAEPRETERDPTASARSHIRRRLHRRRGVLGTGATEVLRRTRLDQDRRSSQQVLLDLLQFTQDGNAGNGNSNGGLSSAATTASSTVSASSVDAGLGSSASAPRQPVYRRNVSEFLSVPSMERAREEDHYEPYTYGSPSSNMLPSLLPPMLRIVSHPPSMESTLPPTHDHEQERQRERERQRQLEREIERNRERNESILRDLQNLGEVYSTRYAGSSYTRDEVEEQASYVRESSRRTERENRIMETMREQIRELGGGVLPDVLGRRGGGAIDGLGDRERSLSPDRSPWSYFPSSFTDFPADISTHCDFLSDGESEAGAEDGPEIDVLAGVPRRRYFPSRVGMR